MKKLICIILTAVLLLLCACNVVTPPAESEKDSESDTPAAPESSSVNTPPPEPITSEYIKAKVNPFMTPDEIKMALGEPDAEVFPDDKETLLLSYELEEKDGYYWFEIYFVRDWKYNQTEKPADGGEYIAVLAGIYHPLEVGQIIFNHRKLTVEDAKKLSPFMTTKEVKQIIGHWDDVNSGNWDVKTYELENGKTLTLIFMYEWEFNKTDPPEKGEEGKFFVVMATVSTITKTENGNKIDSEVIFNALQTEDQ